MSKASSTSPLPINAAARPAGSGAPTLWSPNTDVYLCEAGAVIKVEVAGVKKEDLEITADGPRLTITGVRRDECRHGSCNFQAMEIHYGAFESVVELPAAFDLSQARASYQNGFLRVDVPAKTPAAKA